MPALRWPHGSPWHEVCNAGATHVLRLTQEALPHASSVFLARFPAVTQPTLHISLETTVVDTEILAVIVFQRHAAETGTGWRFVVTQPYDSTSAQISDTLSAFIPNGLYLDIQITALVVSPDTWHIIVLHIQNIVFITPTPLERPAVVATLEFWTLHYIPASHIRLAIPNGLFPYLQSMDHIHERIAGDRVEWRLSA
uniref:Uncharacterized protein n=1 Tax=Mycena chlorophos TaxID=658473 RepID=A0ABQ0LHF8_MYCCL|nr:predicted protein [Mycena chlorophos]